VKPALIDTDVLSMFFRNIPRVTQQFERYLSEYSQINFSILTFYEIVSGLKHRDARKQLDEFRSFSNDNRIVPISRGSCNISTDIYADLRSRGQPIGDIDILIAGSAITNNLVLVTHNTRHFERIEILTIEDWNIL